MARTGVTLSVALLLAVFEIGSCLRCRQCNSQSDPTCADPYTSTKPSVDCSTQDSTNYNNMYLRNFLPSEANTHLVGAPRFCHKIVTHTGTVIRACLDSNPINVNQTCQFLDSASQIDPSKKIRHCSACNKDDCNGASAAVASLPLAVVTLLASYLYYKQ
ncbi:uncharacterized protein LOC135078823 [Ostrinia nubilalis]|uniref:uncharacterized protein LOC114353827 n=1 Tax=Ostrinia furnacalis TaxID=93504 RepID=UPI00103FA56E|nr:uncharacterized protein LOC114353827 [Ostrinia furnacalis]